ncbi:MAG: helix-turn-helix domain-containing protein, partial [Desemzia incerta]
SYLETTPETVSRKFAELEVQGLIEQKTPKLIKVVDLDRLLLIEEKIIGERQKRTRIVTV